MKSLYQCEKCGKLFDNWDDAYKCEATHVTPSLVDAYQLPNDFDIKPFQYLNGEEMPDTIMVKFPVRDAEGNNVTSTENGVEVDEYTVRQYKLVRPTKETRAILGAVAQGLHDESVNSELEMKRWREQREAEAEAKAERQDNESNEDNEE